MTSDEKVQDAISDSLLLGTHLEFSGKDLSIFTDAYERMCAYSKDFPPKRMACSFFIKPSRNYSIFCFKNDDDIAFFSAELKKIMVNPAKQCLIHAAYASNLGGGDEKKLEASINCVAKELDHITKAGLELLCLHPGHDNCSTREASLTQAAESINVIHSITKKGCICLETMAGSKNTTEIGMSFEELAFIISRVKDKDRIGVVYDTCHTFASGYDIRTEEGYIKTFEQFDKIIGFKYLKGVHLNDSLGEFKSQEDLHAIVGKGNIGVTPFKLMMRDKRFRGIPLITERSGFARKKKGQPEPDVKAVEKIVGDELEMLYKYSTTTD